MEPRDRLEIEIAAESEGWPWRGLLLTAAAATGFYSLYCIYNYRQLSQLSGYIPPKATDATGSAVVIGKRLRIRILNLDGSLLAQKQLLEKYKPEVLDVSSFGPPLRIECSFSQYWRYEKAIKDLSRRGRDDIATLITENGVETAIFEPMVTFYGSNDFHHLSLPLIRRIHQPFNLVLFDNHPDWYKFFPRLHCGCWFSHAMDLPTVQQAFHFGGASGEFEDRWGFHPWEKLINGKLAFFPTEDRWEGLKWDKVKYETLRANGRGAVTEQRVRFLLEPYRAQLSQYPLYVTFDKDCLVKEDNMQNWNSGTLTRLEALTILRVLIELSNGRLIAMDVTGDFSAVKVKGVYRSYLHHAQHDDEENLINPEIARPNNEATNLALLALLESTVGGQQTPHTAV